ncbi:MAG TPA: sulfatase-like hydrolase/transferase [Candidatus Polarisedimenticolaceae bacterium]|nr:sulfatase-like hydrolase/transferase [Candidatus Polarisedimenticolaceae bacterium]
MLTGLGLRLALASAMLALAVATPSGCSPDRVPATPRCRGVLLVTVDGLRPESLSAYGGAAATPALEALAKAGVAYRDAWTADPLTRPAIATYLTGLAPDRHGVRDNTFGALPSDVASLAAALTARGYRTAAFPGSAWLRADSGLLRGFELVDDPPEPGIGIRAALPFDTPPAELAQHVVAWREGLPADTSFFAWVHFGEPLAEALRRAALPLVPKIREEDDEAAPPATPTDSAPVALGEFDAALGSIVHGLESRGDLPTTLILVVGTQGEALGGEREPVGPGFSLAEAAVRVPLVARFPEGVRPARGAGDPVWAPDVAATIAQLTQTTLDRRAEGLALLEPAPAERVRLAWSWAPLDELGWTALRAARRGTVDLSGEELTRAFAARAEPPSAWLPTDEVRPLLIADGVQLDPRAPTGRAFGPAERRRQVSHDVWMARAIYGLGRARRAGRLYQDALAADPEARAALVERAQIATHEGTTLLRRALSWYPGDPDGLHWYAHSEWGKSKTPEKLLELIQKHRPGNYDVLYDLACGRSRAGDLEAAARYLEQAIAAGYRRFEHMDADPDLRNLRASPRYAEVMKAHRP